MALIYGTNCGFVTTAPTSDPETATGYIISNTAVVTHDTSPPTAIKITEIGWYCETATQAANFEVGLYVADGGVVPNEAGTLLYVSRTNAKGTDVGWKVVTGLNWDIDPNIEYWIGIQLDNTSATSRTGLDTTGGTGADYHSSQSTLPDPFGSGSFANSQKLAIYAVWEKALVGTNMKLNIADDFKDVDSMQINIGNVWKDVTEVKINIGDTWKTIF